MARLTLDAEALSGERLPNTENPRRLDLFKRREAAEPSEKACAVCHEIKLAEHFKKVPVGGRAHTCDECIRGKQTKTQRRMEDPSIVIMEELWKQYDEAEHTSEKIRCLEALTKLQGSTAAPVDPNSKLSEPAVVASLMKRLKAKRASDGQ